jgi:hypothetical protein
MGALPKTPWFIVSVRGVSQPYYRVETASEALRIERLVDLSDASHAHTLQPRTQLGGDRGAQQLLRVLQTPGLIFKILAQIQ